MKGQRSHRGGTRRRVWAEPALGKSAGKDMVGTADKAKADKNLLSMRKQPNWVSVVRPPAGADAQ